VTLPANDASAEVLGRYMTGAQGTAA